MTSTNNFLHFLLKDRKSSSWIVWSLYRIISNNKIMVNTCKHSLFLSQFFLYSVLKVLLPNEKIRIFCVQRPLCIASSAILPLAMQLFIGRGNCKTTWKTIKAEWKTCKQISRTGSICSVWKLKYWFILSPVPSEDYSFNSIPFC